MALPNVFSLDVAQALQARIGSLNPAQQALWGKMNVAQMLAHCNVTYEMVYEPGKHKKPGALLRFVLKSMVKPKVVGEQAYKQNGPTAPQFIITDSRAFEAEQRRLCDFIARVQQEGASAFEGRESHSFGKLSSEEWNNMFYKHLDHHLKQFGV